ncbi:MAG: hypothetical protein HWD58_05455 [Bacteroidota bacterium]|nr:MAG: hypothetical protein HWD58_05455 [Bacteroidota bacterium]
MIRFQVPFHLGLISAFQSQYSQCYLADNGVLTFSPLYNLSACNNNTQQTLPYYNSTFPDNAIFFCLWM